MTMENILSEYNLGERIVQSPRTLVYRATRLADGLPCVVKTSQKEHPTTAELGRLQREYDILWNLPEEGVVRLYSIARFRSRLALVMEDIGGISLRALMAQRKLSLDEILDITIRVARALARVHQRRVVHRDVNPANIVVHPETLELRLIDFSIASTLSREVPSLRVPGIIEGTLRYMSPEQTGRVNRAVDYRTDLYSLGITIYELLAGEPPFDSEDALGLIHAQIAVAPAPLHERVPGVPRAVSDVVHKLLAKAAEDRHQSAFGLIRDLEAIRASIRTTGGADGFVPGRNDISLQFQLPQKLYGRVADAEILRATFERVAAGAVEVLLVTGYSGIGKTSLVNEIHKPLVQARGYFATGKFEQLRRNIPYASLVDAFQELIRQLLAEKEDQLAAWREELRAALGANAPVIAELVPALELVLGKQPAPLPLGPTESQNRFHFAFHSFVRVFATAAHPLVLYLDDLQWADLASLNLIVSLLGDESLHHLCLIGAYRDNEVIGTHPLLSALVAFVGTGRKTTRVTLSPLGIDDIISFVDDALHCGREQAGPLATLLLQKTEGNPFFLGQLLSSLVSDSLIEPDPDAGMYCWDLDEIRERGITSDVVELMVGKIQRLDAASQRALELASCIGNRFDLRTLSVILRKTPGETAQALRSAIDEGLLVPLANITTFSLGPESGSVEDTLPAAVFRFLHDRVQQAAYSLLDERARRGIHVELGRYLLSRIPTDSGDEDVFDVVNQFMLGLDCIEDEDERYLVAQLSLRAARRAKLSAAFETALRYVSFGIRLLPENAFENQHEFSMTLHIEGAESEYLNAHMDQAQALADVAMANSSTIVEKVKVLETQMLFNISRNRFEDTIRDGLVALDLLGVHLPRNATRADVEEALRHNRALLDGRPITELVDLPETKDWGRLAAQRILIQLAAPTKTASPILFQLVACEQLRQCVLYGNSRFAPIAYVTYGALHASVLRDADAALAWGELSAQVLERYGAREAKCNVYILLAVLIKPWKVPIRETLDLLREGLAAGVETADLQSAGHCASNSCTSPLIAGLPLDVVREMQVRNIDFLAHLKHEMLRLFGSIPYQAVLNLQGKSAEPCELVGDAFDEVSLTPALVAAKNLSSLCVLYTCKTMLSYFFGRYADAVKFGDLAQENRHGLMGHPMLIMQNLYQSLALLAVAGEAPKGSRNAFLEKVARNQVEMSYWAKNAPMNCLHKWQMVEAERLRLEGRAADAISLYEESIRRAAEQQFIQDEALACERAAMACHALGWERARDAYLEESHYAYVRWGALAKVAQLERLFPDQLAGKSEVTQPRGAITTSHHSSSSSTGENLELTSVMKAAQAISREIVLEKLVHGLLRIMLENAGAQRGFFLLERESVIVIEAECSAEKEETIPRGTVLVEGEERLSAAIVNYVVRTGESIVLANAAAAGRFTKDPYVIAKRPKSVLCVPLATQSRVVGLIYLENNLTEDAFTASRLEVLRLLSGQAALSIHNANLYATLEQKVVERTRELVEKNAELTRTQKQLVMQEKLASLGALTAGIAHELKNPLNFVNNFASVSHELVDELRVELEANAPRIDEDSRENIAEILTMLQQNVAKIESHGKRANQIISSMLQHSRNTVGERGQVDVNAIVVESVMLSIQGATHRERAFVVDLRAKYDHSIGTIDAVAGDISRVFLSLVENACYALIQKKKRLGDTFSPVLEVSTADLGSSVEITIRDNGTGIRSDALEKIFMPFFTTKPPGEGTGLGLSLSHDIVDAHRGTMRVTSTFGEYTEFVVRLPRSPLNQS